MNLLYGTLLFFSAALPITAFADDFVVEDEQLLPLPKKIEASIRGAKGFEDKSCKLVGKQVDLSGQPGGDSGYIATTADACNWGAAIAPIWVVRDGALPLMVLHYGGYALTLGKPQEHGLRNIAISAATAGAMTESLWKYDGKRYNKTKEKRTGTR